MKLQYWVTIAAANALWTPAYAWDHGAQSGPAVPMPQPPVSRPDSAGSFLPEIDPALPNRRVPSLAPPRPDSHPITPGEAWPKPPPPIKPALPDKKSGMGNIVGDKALSRKGGPGLAEPLQGVNGTGGSIPAQPLNETGNDDVPQLPRVSQ